MACKVVDPGGNILCEFRNHYFARKRHRDGSFYSESDWVGITQDFFEMFVDAGSSVLTEAPAIVRQYVYDKYPSVEGREPKNF